MELNSQKTEKSHKKIHPFWIGLGFGGAVYVIVLAGVTLLQFFLQFTLAAGSQDTSEFWTQGILISFFLGSALGIPAAVLAGILAVCITLLIRWLTKKGKE
jgi:hypothetical protein